MCVLMVCFNVLELLLDEKAMPRGMEVRIQPERTFSCYLCCSQSSVFTEDSHVFAFQDPHLGMASFSMFGSLGAAVQVVLILYPFYPIHV